MIEIRWVKDDQGYMQLQQRTRNVCVDATGAFCQFTEWSEWKAVPVVHDPHAFTDFVDVFNTKNVPGESSEDFWPPDATDRGGY